MKTTQAVHAVLTHYPRIYFACHQRHRTDPEQGRRISSRQASILDHLDEVEPMGLTDLAEHMGVTPSTMSLHVDRLERDGYVVRTPDPADGRRVRLLLTAAGRRVSEAGSVLEPARVRAILERLDEEDRAAALRGLRLLAGAADAEMRDLSRKGSWARARKGSVD